MLCRVLTWEQQKCCILVIVQWNSVWGLKWTDSELMLPASKKQRLEFVFSNAVSTSTLSLRCHFSQCCSHAHVRQNMPKLTLQVGISHLASKHITTWDVLRFRFSSFSSSPFYRRLGQPVERHTSEFWPWLSNTPPVRFHRWWSEYKYWDCTSLCST